MFTWLIAPPPKDKLERKWSIAFWSRLKRKPERGFGCFLDRKSTRLNSSHSQISYAVFCLQKQHPPCHLRPAGGRAPDGVPRPTPATRPLPTCPELSPCTPGDLNPARPPLLHESPAASEHA